MTWCIGLGRQSADILLGNGNGTFQAKHDFATGNVPISVELTDLNGDGKCDLVSRGLCKQHRERAARQRQRDVSGQAVLRHGKPALDSRCGRPRRRRCKGLGDRQPRHRYCEPAGGQWNDDHPDDDHDHHHDDHDHHHDHDDDDCLRSASDNRPELSHASRRETAQGQIDGYLDCVNHVSGTIGAALTRFQIAGEMVQAVADLSTAAEARITDADVATDVANLVRQQILQQGATAILAQANQQPALALGLLQG